MNINNHPIAIGQTVFYAHITGSGNTMFKPGVVVDLNEHVKAVKLRHQRGKRAGIRASGGGSEAAEGGRVK